MAIPGFNQPFSSYAPHPSGGTMFSGAGGNTLLAGPAADDLKRQIDASAGPDNRLAMNANAAAAASAYDVGNGGVAGFAQAQHDKENADAMRAALTGGAPQAHSAAPSVAPAPPNPTGPPQTAGQMSAGAQPVRAITTPQAGAPGVAGPTPGIRADLGEYVKMHHVNPGFTPTSRKIETAGGIQNPELQSAYIKSTEDQMKALSSQAELDKLQAASQVQQNQVAAAAAAKEADDLHTKQLAQQAGLLEGTKEFDRIMAIKQKELENVSGREVDNDRLFRGKPGAQIGAAISAALGAFGSALSHTPNFALDIINKHIDNDIASQREAINRGVAAKQNDIVRVRDKYGVDTSMAEKLLNIDMTDRAAALARKQAALVGGAEAMQRLAAIDSGLAAKKAALIKQLNDDALGKAQITAEEKYRQGGDVPIVDPRLKAYAQVSGLMGDIGAGQGRAVAGEYQATHEGMTATQAAKANGGGGYTAQTISSINAADVGEHALRHVAKLGGMEVDESGEVHVTDWGKYMAAHANPNSAYNKALAAAVPEVVRGQTGAAPTNEGQAHMASQFGVTGSPNAIQENIRLLRSARNIRVENKKMPVAPSVAAPEASGSEE